MLSRHGRPRGPPSAGCASNRLAAAGQAASPPPLARVLSRGRLSRPHPRRARRKEVDDLETGAGVRGVRAEHAGRGRSAPGCEPRDVATSSSGLRIVIRAVLSLATFAVSTFARTSRSRNMGIAFSPLAPARMPCRSSPTWCASWQAASAADRSRAINDPARSSASLWVGAVQRHERLRRATAPHRWRTSQAGREISRGSAVR